MPWQRRPREELRAAEELQAAGGHPVPGVEAADVKWSTLTSQERRVVEAILAGASYRPVAGRLVLSPRTVEFHLRPVYRKLGVSSRGELAALATLAGVSRDAH